MTTRLSSILVLMAALSFFAEQVRGQERLYATRSLTRELFVFDPATGSQIDAVPFGTQPYYAGALGCDGSRLYNMANRFGNQMFTFSQNPADAQQTQVGFAGYHNASWPQVEIHPVTGVVYGLMNTNNMANDWDLVTLDKTTGQATLVGRLIGPVDCFCGFAIDPTGFAYMTGNGTGSPGNWQSIVYSLDLSFATVGILGVMAVPEGGSFQDLAFDSNGQLWGAYEDRVVGQGSAGNFSGLYKIDVNQFVMTPMVLHQWAFRGIAFGPETVQQSYCTAKVNSLGCAPAISAEGLASAAGTFGYRVKATNVRNNTFGLMTYSLTGRAAVPFKGGVLCVAARRYRTPLTTSGGTPAPAQDCSGEWVLDFNEYSQQKRPLPPGTTVWAQWYGRDGGLPPPDGVSLSDGLEFVMMP